MGCQVSIRLLQLYKNALACFILGSLLSLSGCGGGGDTTVSTHGHDFIVEPISVANGNTWSSGSIGDDGLIYGTQGGTAATEFNFIWPTPSSYIKVPKMDGKAFYQNLDGISADHNTVLGNTIDINNSGGPGRAFLYSLLTGQFRVLDIATSTQMAPYPQAIQPDGTVAGWTQAPNNYWIGGQHFIYNLTTNTYTLTTPNYWSGNPDFPRGSTSQGSCSSPNGRFVGGSMIYQRHSSAVIWDMQKMTYRQYGPLDLGYQATELSNDGSVAAIHSNQVGLAYYLLVDGKLTDLIGLCQRKGIGLNWLWLNAISISPSGNYITFTGQNFGGYGQAVRIRIR